MANDLALTENKEVYMRFLDSIEKSTKNFYSINLTETQKRLIAGYYNGINEAVKNAEVSWKDIRLDKLAIQLANKSILGLDISMEHFYPIVYKEKKGVTVNLQLSYKGRIFLTKKFAYNPPLDIRGELIYENDKFTLVKKGIKSPCDNYELEITNPFDRGKIIGAVGLAIFDDERLNIVVTLSKDEMDKRHRTTKFWVNWADKMYLKTIINELCTKIPLDFNKISDYQEVINSDKEIEIDFLKEIAQDEANEKINSLEEIRMGDNNEDEISIND